MAPKYEPNRVGHAPGRLRRAFEVGLDLSLDEPLGTWYEHLDREEIYYYDTQQQAWWDSLTFKERRVWLIEQFWCEAIQSA